jgi:non-heme chloroperoxidase
MSPNNNPPIVFIHGLWLHGESWHKWLDFFRQHGYDAIAASWSGDGATTEATRRNANAVAGYGVTEIANHIAKQLQQFHQQPILIGHSFGGVIAQNLLGRNLAAAAIAQYRLGRSRLNLLPKYEFITGTVLHVDGGHQLV